MLLVALWLQIHGVHVYQTHAACNQIALTKGQRSKRQLLNSFQWPIKIIKTKLPCYTLPPTQHHSFLRN